MSELKLTKKQLKADAFKAAKAGKGKEADTPVAESDVAEPSSEGKKKKRKQPSSAAAKGKGSRLVPDGGDLPELDLDPENDEPVKPRKSAEKEDKKGKKDGKRKADNSVGEVANTDKLDLGKKRKRGVDEHDGAKAQAAATTPIKQSKVKGKSRKLEETAFDTVATSTHLAFDEDGEAVAAEVKVTAAERKEREKPNKYIVFVGNMSFTTTSLEIAKHFEEHCGEKPTVRLLTKKADPSALAALSASKRKSIAKGKAANPAGPTSKGCAFVEFTTPAALQKALRFHHTMLGGRQINVELTAGGGGKGQERRAKISKKNQALDDERKKLHEKYVKPAAEANKAKAAAREGGEPAAKKPRLGPGEGEAQWGRRAGGSAAVAAASKPKGKWAASGPNAVRLQG